MHDLSITPCRLQSWPMRIYHLVVPILVFAVGCFASALTLKGLHDDWHLADYFGGSALDLQGQTNHIKLITERLYTINWPPENLQTYYISLRLYYVALFLCAGAFNLWLTIYWSGNIFPTCLNPELACSELLRQALTLTLTLAIEFFVWGVCLCILVASQFGGDASEQSPGCPSASYLLISGLCLLSQFCHSPCGSSNIHIQGYIGIVTSLTAVCQALLEQILSGRDLFLVQPFRLW